MNTDTYISEGDLSPTDIKAGLAKGVLQLWRVDANGAKWYKQARTIHAVPPTEPTNATDEADDVIQCDDHDAEADDDLASYRTSAEAERERAVKHYRNLVAIRASGQDIDPAFGREVLEAAGKSMFDFNCDVFAAQQVLAELGEC